MSKKASKQENDKSKEIEEEYEELLIEESLKQESETIKEVPDLELQDTPGLGKKTLEILQENNIMTIDQLMTTRLLELQEMGIQRAIAKKCRDVITKIVSKYKYFKEEIGLEDLPGVGKTTAVAMREKGLNIYLIETTPIRELEEKYGVTSSSAIKYKEDLRQLRGGIDFINAFDIMEKQRDAPAFTYGLKSIDALQHYKYLLFFLECLNGG
ncbi:hypothetical protein ES708_34746 [subsurface metagenome]